MHPSNNLLLPILRKHGDRLLKAQIEAMVKELSWEEQARFLRNHLDSTITDIREKLFKSYPSYTFLTEWQPESFKTKSRVWVFVLSGEQNYLLGIPDFTLILSEFELGRPSNFIALKPQTNEHIYSINTDSIVTNGYKLKRSDAPNVYPRLTYNELEDAILFQRKLITNPGLTRNKFLRLIIDMLITKKMPTKHVSGHFPE